MGSVKLEIRPNCPSKINGITLDPKPDWSFNDLISELNALELKQNNSSNAPIFVKTQPREFPNKTGGGSRISKAFVMRVSDDDDSESDDNEENHDPNLITGKRFACADLYLSDSDNSEDDLALEETQACLMEPVGLLEVLLSQREIEHQHSVEEDIRHQIALLEMDLLNENEKSTSALIQLEKLKEAKREMNRKMDMQCRRKIAEALDNHLIAVQRTHEQKSQIEERKIRTDAEEAKRKERALHEERVRQEKAKAEAEAVQRKAEEAKKEALEAEARRIMKEAAEKKDNEAKSMASGEAGQKASGSLPDLNGEASKEIMDRGIKIMAAESALKKEAERLQKFNESLEKNQALRLSSNQDFHQYELQIGRHIRQISGTIENVRTKANELNKILNNRECPQSISISMFAKKVVSQCESLGANFDSTAFACGHVIVLVTSQAPLAMDLLLAELHRACIYTIPKYVAKSKSCTNKEGYLKLLGYQEKDGEMEDMESYLRRLESYMKLYGALVQTEINGVRNLHGIEEGWAWIARLLNAIPANIYTAVALEAFLKMAGYKLFQKYKSQFKKILNLISTNVVTTLEARGDPKLNPILAKIKTYIDMNQFLKAPDGWQMQASLLSDEMGIPDTSAPQSYSGNYHNQSYSGNYQNHYYNQSNRW